ncbi:MAG: hypothetical protein Ct9H300mP20_17650 [Gammaproteobacteria bacterium]|nr:MAG: hypothetical protein Ct9H300mP20_17650 [Gammaproteobacteria bacterium]
MGHRLKKVVRKVYMVRDGLFDDVDVVLHWHPGSVNHTSPELPMQINLQNLLLRDCLLMPLVLLIEGGQHWMA